jgi:phage head maturation protease
VKHKSAPAQLSPENDEESGTFEAIVSVFNNKDLGGDVVMPGAFVKSLEHWKSTGNPIPIYWSHRMDSPEYNIGAVTEARELEGGDPAIPEWANEHVKANGGLYVKGKLDDHDVGKRVSYLLKNRRVTQFSFSYDVLRETKSKSGDANELHEVWLHEVGPTPLGMNPLTELIAAKSQPNPDPPPGPGPTPEPDTKRRQALFSCRTAIELAAWDVELAE